MGQRIKGQEVEVLLILNGAPKTNITAIKNFEVNLDLDILSEGYLGETTERKDEVFKGVSGKMDMHFDTQDIFKVFQAIVDRARRRTPGTKINIKSTLNFPNGQRPRILIPDVSFGQLPMNFGSRVDYGQLSMTFQASDNSYLY